MLSRIHPAWLFFGGSSVLLVVLAGILFGPDLFSRRPQSTGPIVVHCAASQRAVLEQIAQDFERDGLGQVELRFGASADILSKLQISGQGDVFLPADESYIALAHNKDLIAEVIPVARMNAVVVVPAGNPKKIANWNDLLTKASTLAQAEPDAAAIGKLTREHLSKSGRWDALRGKTTVFMGTVTEVANAVALKSADAGIVWDTDARPNSKLAMIDLPELKGIDARVQIAVLKTSRQPTQALQFAKYVTAPDKGLRRYRDHGFTRVEAGDTFGKRPELILYAGAMLQPAVEETIKEFERREDVDVKRIYNGCGILVSQMKAGERPDLFFACDTSFMTQAQEWFAPSAVISSNQLVIAVQKGNPHDVRTLKELAKPGLRVGVGHEQQCALGAITKETFKTAGVYSDIAKNVVVQSPTGDLLVNQLRVKSLDAVVAYMSNVLPYEKDIDYTPVTGIPCAAPTQPIAVGKTTAYPRMSDRLIQAIQSAESQKRFEELGFGWQNGKARVTP